MARKKPQKRINNILLAKFAIFLGILLFFLGTLQHFHIISNARVAFSESPRNQFSAQNPRQIVIPAISLSIGVSEGGIIDGNWILSDTEALYLPTSGKVGEGYNTIIYAHNTKILFGALKSLKNDDKIIIRDHKGRNFTYKVYSIEEIDPSDVGKLYSEEKNILTLFTCSGWFDKERLLIRAKLTSPIPSTTRE